MGQVPGFLGLPQLVLYLGQGVPQRLNQVLDRSPAGLQLARGLGVGGAEPPLRDLQEHRGAAVERLRGHGLEALGELAVDQRGPLLGGALHDGRPVLGGPCALLRGAGLPGQVGGHAGQPAAGVQVTERGANHAPQHQKGEHPEDVHGPPWWQRPLTVSCPTRLASSPVGRPSRGPDHPPGRGEDSSVNRFGGEC